MKILLTNDDGVHAEGLLELTKYLEKNPPVNEKMVREMMRQMGRTPSEKQVRQVMASMNAAK